MHERNEATIEATPIAGSRPADVIEIQESSGSNDVQDPGARSVLAISEPPFPPPARSQNGDVDIIVVPRAQRRGLLARFAILPEVADPYAYPRSSKWTITAIVAIAGAAGPVGSAIVLPALSNIARTFDCSQTTVNLSVAMWLLAMSLFPLWWSSFSEIYGRRTIYITSFVLFTVFNVLTSVSVNIAMFITFRTLAGGAVASIQAVGAGTVADIWEPKERGMAIGLFYLGPLCGPLLSPIIGGALTQSLGWVSAQWFITILGAGCLLLIVVGLPETLRVKPSPGGHPATRSSDEEKAQTTSRTSTATSTKSTSQIRRALVEPLAVIKYLRFPAVSVTVYYSCITFITLYVLSISIQRTFEREPYRYENLVVGLLYIPSSLGYIVSSILGGRWIDYIMLREAKRSGQVDENGKLRLRPEDRLKENAWISGIMWPFATLMYAWCAQYGVNVGGPVVALFFFGVGSMLVTSLVTTMLTEYMPGKSSSGVALNNCCRYLCACVGVVVTEPLLVAMGTGWMFTGLSIIGLFTGLGSIWLMRRNGSKWREEIDVHLNPDGR